MSRIYDALKDAEHRRTNGAESATPTPPSAAATPERTGLMGALKTKLFSSARPGGEAAKLTLKPQHSGDESKSRPATPVDEAAKSGPAGAKAVEPSRERPTMDQAARAAAGGTLPPALPEAAREEQRVDELAGSGNRPPETSGFSQQLDSASAEIASVEASFSQLAERLPETARSLQEGSAAPSESFIAEVTNCRKGFLEAGAILTKLARSAGVPSQYISGPPGSIGDLRTLWEITSFHDNRRRAITALDQVLSIAYRDGAEFQPLLECQARARQLREAISSSEWPAYHPESQSLSSAEHPFAKLAILIEQGEKLSDERWLSFHDEVADTFGKPLAVAITRNRLRMAGAASVGAPVPESLVEESALRSVTLPEEPASRCWSCNAELEDGAKFCGECGAPSA